MSDRTQLLVAAMAFVAVAAVGLFVPAPTPVAPPPTTTDSVPFVFPFPTGSVGHCQTDCQEVLAVASGNTTRGDVLAAWHREQPTGPDAQVLLPSEPLRRNGPLAFFALETACARCVGPQVVRPPLDVVVWTADGQESGTEHLDAARFGVDGRTEVTFTFYAFRSNGRLLATNAVDADLLRFDLDGDFVRIAPQRYHLGNDAVPPESTRLPGMFASYGPRLAENLTGLPVGGVLARELTDHPLRDAFGPLYVTLRIEELVRPQP